MDFTETPEMDVALIVVIAFCILLLPTIFFVICRLHMRMRKKAHKKASRVSVVSIAPVSSRKKSSISLPPIRHVPPQNRTSNDLSMVEVPDPDVSGLVVLQNNRRVSACYLTELKLMDIGPLPRDQAVLEEEREREKEKRESLAL
ncbi:hypothetical protein RB195_025930 [Necator americanus]|uniref:Uncharacterized protein n=2 Tax=Necator americanus TaxID=51031 RepID=A0ABR1EUK5_NECAM|nr:hypothetical protein NECAME_01082 [Necator americanus]ETN68972.1 hypothetical protein NECAME_01082 [Necator americanus]